MKATGQPSQQARLGTRKINSCHADLGESQRLAPQLQLRKQRRSVFWVYRQAVFGSASLRVMDIHPAIVKTPPTALVWADESATEAFAQRLAHQTALAHAFIALHGDLGAGKTTLVRHLLRALGVQGRVKSPTYAVVEPYELPGLNIWHFDFYRFGDAREWEDAGFRDIFASPGLKLAEWPNQAAGRLPTPDVRIAITVKSDDTRHVLFSAHSAKGLALVQGLPHAF